MTFAVRFLFPQDRDYTIPSLPEELQGLRLTCIQTAQGDKRAGGSRLLRLSLMQVRRSGGWLYMGDVHHAVYFRSCPPHPLSPVPTTFYTISQYINLNLRSNVLVRKLRGGFVSC